MSRNAKLQSGKGRRTKKNTQDPPVTSLSVPVEKGFHFFTDLNEPTGICATSMADFVDDLKKVDLNSIEFHFERNDFSRWLREVVRDNSLADDLDRVHGAGLSGEEIRSSLVELTQKRYSQSTDTEDSSV